MKPKGSADNGWMDGERMEEKQQDSRKTARVDEQMIYRMHQKVQTYQFFNGFFLILNVLYVV